MKTDKVYNLIILDESGSMDSIKRATISGFNEVVQTIQSIEKQYPEQQHFISFVTFNGAGITTHLDKQPIAEMKMLDNKTYNPNSSTPLYDAIGLSVLKLKYDLASQKEVNVLVTILTDGEENASHEFHGQQIKNIIDEQKTHGWTFTYIGANQDVESNAASISISNTLHFHASEAGMNELFTKEKASRQRYSEKLRNKENTQEDFYKE